MCMKKLLLLLITVISSSMLQGQNLVPNPSFEEINVCPTYLDEMSACKYWLNFEDSPDYYNTCASGILKPPYCAAGFQYPHSGDGMAGLITYAWQYAPCYPNSENLLA